jgi:hypothetical protein
VRNHARPERPAVHEEGEDHSTPVPDEIWTLAKVCWERSPQARPFAGVVCDHLSHLIHTQAPPARAPKPIRLSRENVVASSQLTILPPPFRSVGSLNQTPAIMKAPEPITNKHEGRPQTRIDDGEPPSHSTNLSVGDHKYRYSTYDYPGGSPAVAVHDFPVMAQLPGPSSDNDLKSDGYKKESIIAVRPPSPSSNGPPRRLPSPVNVNEYSRSLQYFPPSLRTLELMPVIHLHLETERQLNHKKN